MADSSDLASIIAWRNRLLIALDQEANNHPDEAKRQKIDIAFERLDVIRLWIHDANMQVIDNLEERHFYGKNSFITRVWTKLCISNENTV